MKIRLVDGTTHNVARVEVTNGKLEIDFAEKTAEELQRIFTLQGNLKNIELLTAEEEKFGDLPDWVVYGGTMLVGNIKTVILTKGVNVTEERLVAAEAAAIQAAVKAEEARAIAAQTANNLDEAVVELTMAMEVTGGVKNV